MTAPEPGAEDITLNTIREWAERATETPAGDEWGHARGYQTAAKDVLAILAMHGRPPGELVRFGSSAD